MIIDLERLASTIQVAILQSLRLDAMVRFNRDRNLLVFGLTDALFIYGLPEISTIGLFLHVFIIVGFFKVAHFLGQGRNLCQFCVDLPGIF